MPVMSLESKMDPGRAEELILEEVLRSLEAGKEPDIQHLKAKYPSHSSAVDRLLKACRQYRSNRESLVSHSKSRLVEGNRIGDFEIQSAHAQGGMAVIYRARQLSLGGRLVALKVLLPENQTNANRARFMREASTLAKLHHPNLAEAYGYGEENGLLFYAMRFIDGPSLHDILRKIHKAPEEFVSASFRRALAGWAAEVADALTVLHDAGLVHRDVKPSNVIIEAANIDANNFPSGKAILVDFGLIRSTVATTLTRTGQSPATPSYAPPEQVLGLDVDPSADVFALGSTFHDLLTGRLPQERKQASAGLEPLEELVANPDPALCAILAKATDPESQCRYPTARELREDLQAWREGRRCSAQTSNRRSRWPRPLQLGSVMVAALILLVAVSAPYAIYSTRAARAKEAFQQSDLQALFAELEGIPSLLRRPLLDDELVRVTESFSEQETSPELEIWRFLQSDDVVGALTEAATALRQFRPGQRKLIEGFLLSALSRDRSALSEADPQIGLVALQLGARLFYERPDVSAEDAQESGPFREEFLKLWGEPELSREENLLLLTALSGCGTAQEVEKILLWTMNQAMGSEERRLGLLCVERILRRSHRCGDLAEIDFTWIRDQVQDYAQQSYLAWSELDWDIPPAEREYHQEWAVLNDRGRTVKQFLFATFLAQRAVSGERVRLDLLPLAWQGSCWGKSDYYSACGDPRVLPCLTAAGEIGPLKAGRLCGRYGDPDVVQPTREFWASRPMAAKELPAFELGLEEGILERGGILQGFDLDEDTLLGAPWRSPSVAKGGTHSVEDLPEGHLAVWRPTREGILAGGLARSAEWHFGRLLKGGTLWRLARFGSSELRLVFEVAQQPSYRFWFLDLTHLAAARAYYPFEGDAVLEISLDGFSLWKGRIRDKTLHVSSIQIPSGSLAQGTHQLSILLDRSSTTTYWLSEVRLRTP
jgi:serine/threonine-protein kinase